MTLLTLPCSFGGECVFIIVNNLVIIVIHSDIG